MRTIKVLVGQGEPAVVDCVSLLDVRSLMCNDSIVKMEESKLYYTIGLKSGRVFFNTQESRSANLSYI